jgi:hypothetical protein
MKKRVHDQAKVFRELISASLQYSVGRGTWLPPRKDYIFVSQFFVRKQ